MPSVPRALVAAGRRGSAALSRGGGDASRGSWACVVAPAAMRSVSAALSSSSPSVHARVPRRFLSSGSSHNGASGEGSGSGGLHDATHYRTPTSRVQGLDYYAILEVHRHQLDEGELRRSYYRLAKQLHPDAVVHLPASTRAAAAQRFAQVGVAYNVLSDPKRRQMYDTFLDLSAIGDQDRMLHWVKIHRPMATIAGQEPQSTAQSAAAAPTDEPVAPPKKPKVVLPVFRSS